MQIWRYLDFTKLVSLLHRRELYFSRADLLGDRFEGSYPQANTTVRAAFKRQLQAAMGSKANAIVQQFTDVHRAMTKWTYLNCWHIANHESVPMWKVYTQTSEAVAMQSTYQRLRDCLPDSVLIGEVQYIDFTSDMIPETNTLYPFLYKRLSFAYERELRAIMLSVPSDVGSISVNDFSRQEPGKSVSVDLDKLVERLYVAPGAPAWFLELVRDVARKYDLSKEVHQSALDSDPFF